MNTEAQSGTSELHRRRTYDQACPVAHSMDLLGERWTLLIVRDLMFGPLRFGELREGLPGLSPNLLSTRLADLTSHGLIERFEDPAPGRRHSYRLTPRGRELAPVVHSLARFGAGEWPDPATDPPPPRLLRGALLALMDPAALDDSGWSADLLLDAEEVTLVVSPGPGRRGGLDRLHLAHRGHGTATPDASPGEPGHPVPADGPQLRIETSLHTLWAIRRGLSSADAARRCGELVLEGPSPAAAQLGALLGW